MRKACQSDLTDAQWSCLEPYLSGPRTNGRPKLHSTREILNAIFYVVRSGCAWRLLPNDFPTAGRPSITTSATGAWRRDVGEDALGPARSGASPPEEEPPEPSAAIVDSQSIKTTGVGGEQRGYDGAKKVKGRKRHLLVDTQGLVLVAKVHDASGEPIATASSSCWIPPRAIVYPSACRTCGWTPAATPVKTKAQAGGEDALGWTAEIVRHPRRSAPEEVMMRWVREFNKEGLTVDPKKFMPHKGPRPFLPKRWIVERTFSWLGQNRRMSKDYERLPESSEAFIYVAMSRLMAGRLARS